MFATRLSYVIKTGGRYQLQISDSDGQDARIALNSRRADHLARLVADGTKVAYVSFEKKKPVVYRPRSADRRARASVESEGQQQRAGVVAGRPQARGHALAHGRHAAVRRSSRRQRPRRLTQGSSIDTEPRTLRRPMRSTSRATAAAQPQIYKMSANGESAGAAQRVTFTGNYNTSPRVSPDGKQLAYISRVGGGFKLYLQDLVVRYGDRPHRHDA